MATLVGDSVGLGLPVWKSVPRWAVSALPKGDALPAKDWAQRHRAILLILWCHVFALLAYGALRGYTPEHTLIDTLPVVFAAVLASKAASRRLQSGPPVSG